MSKNEEIYPQPWIRGTVFFNPETGEIHALGTQDIDCKDAIKAYLSRMNDVVLRLQKYSLDKQEPSADN